MIYTPPIGDELDIQFEAYTPPDGDVLIIDFTQKENPMGNIANVIDRPFESIVIAGVNGGAALSVQLVTGNAKITTSEDAPTLANKMLFQRGVTVDFTYKLSEVVLGGGMRRMGLSKVEVGEAGVGGIEPVTYTDLGFPNSGKATLSSVPYYTTTPDSQKLIRGKDTTLTIDLLETADQNRSDLEGFRYKILWVKLTTAIGDVFKLKNVRMVMTADYGLSSDDTNVHTVKFVKRSKKITDVLVVPATMTLLGPLEDGEAVHGDITVTDVYGNDHILDSVAYGLGVSFDLSDDANPTFDLTGTKYVEKLSDVYSMVPA